VARLATRRPHQNHHTVGQTPNGDQTSFSIVPTIIVKRQMITVEHSRRLGEIQSTLNPRAITLAGIEGDAHRFLLLQK
jgi:hypothetical protein